VFVRGNLPLSVKVALVTVAGSTFLVPLAWAEPAATDASPGAPSAVPLTAATAAGDPVTSPPDKPFDTGSVWGGWYLGGHVGYARGTGNTTLSDPAPQGSASSFGSLYGGALVGYGVQLRSRFLLGLEADVSFPNFLDDDDLISLRKTAGGSVAERLDLLSRARGRLGCPFDRWLVYAAGGFAWSLGRFIQSPGPTQAQEERLHFRPGWTMGAGVEFAFAPRWTTRIEYLYDRFGTTSATFASGTSTESTMALHSVRLALSWQMHSPAADVPREKPPAGDERNWIIHGQFTYVEQGYFGFHSPYEGPNSLSGASQIRNTASATILLGRRLWTGGEIYFNPEFMQGFGLNDVHGVAAFSNGEAQKSSFRFPRFNAARLFLSQTFGFGGEKEIVEDGPNQLAGKRSVSRLTVTVGKFAVLDYFLVNPYAGEPRTAFLNWNAYGGGSYDWTMDRLSWTWGGLVELNQKRWALRAGYFLLPEVSNSNHFDTHIPERGQYTAELELRYAPFAKPGKLLLFGWLSHGNMGSYSDALAEPFATPGYPDITVTRQERTKYGFVASAEQTITADLGAFSRASWSPGHTEIMGWTDCDESLSVGAALKGTYWRRPNDTVGIAWVAEGLSAISRQYFGAGGMGILIGDGKLNYRPEMVIESYYAFSPVKWAVLSLDYQLIADPGYNADRGPVSIFSGRLHAAF
jgi:Carbohydrate-selective porin